MKRGRTNVDDSTYPLFVTTTITGFIPVFRDSALAVRVLQMFEERRAVHDMTVYAYVLMPHHIHAILKAPRKGETSAFMGSWKSLSARVILDEVNPDVVKDLAEAARHFGEPERKKHKVWMSRFDDVALYDQNTFATKLEYINYNPVRAGLVQDPEDYRFSSARFYVTGSADSMVSITDCRPLLAGRVPSR